MRLTIFLIFALFIAFLSFTSNYDVISDGGEFISFNQVAMRFQGTDAVISVSYGLDIFSSMYVFLLGAHNLEPAIDGFFTDFGDMEILEINDEHAVVLARNVSRMNDEYYLHDSHELGNTVNVLVMINPDGSTQTMYNTNVTPNVFYNE